MPAIDFPAAPAVNDEYSFEGRTWRWNGTGWEVKEYPAALLAGTAANPSLYFSGDPNTGLYSPGADQVAVATNGTGRLFVDSAGNVGVGVGSPVTALQVVGTATFGNGVGGRLQATTDANLGYIDSLNNTSTQWQPLIQRGTEIQFHTNTAGVIPAEKVRITPAGLVGIGTSSPSFTAHVSGAKNTSQLFIDAPTISAANDYAQIGFGLGGTAFGLVRLGFDNPSGVSNSYLSFYNNSGSSNVERMRIDSSGRVGIGTTSPSALIHGKQDVDGVSNILDLENAASSSAPETIIRLGRPGTSGRRVAIRALGGTNFTSPQLAFDVNESERLRIDSSGRLLVGTSTAISDSGFGTGRLQVTTDGLFQNVIFSAHNSTAINGSALTLARSRGSLASPTFLSAGDLIGRYQFSVWAGTEYRPTAIVEAEADLAHASGDLPSRLVFSVTADGASSPTEAMRIKNSRILNFANTPTYADNTAAKAGGLVDGDVYRKSDGTLMIVYT